MLKVCHRSLEMPVFVDGMLRKRTPQMEKEEWTTFFHCKNDERHRQQVNKKNVAANMPQASSITSATMTLTDLQESVSLSEHRQAFNVDGVVKWSRMEINYGSVLQPTASILLNHYLS